MKLSKLIEEELRGHLPSTTYDDFTAAITARLHECARPLVWRQGDECFKADSPFGRYEISDGGGSIAVIRLKGSIIARVAWGKEKAAAQAHYAAQIIAGLDL